jgi:O-antigen/teichoic acid export membrane protein
MMFNQITGLFRITRVRSLQWFNIIRFGATFSLGILLAKSGLPTASISIYETLLFLGNLVSFFWLGGGQNGLLSYYPKLDEEAKKGAILQSFLLFVGLGVLSCGALLVFQPLFLRYFSTLEELPYFHWLVLYLFLNLPTHLIHIIYLLEDRYRAIVRFGGIAFGLQVLIVILPVLLGWGLKYSFIGLCLWALFKLIWILWMLRPYFGATIERSALIRYAGLSLPLMLHLLIGNSVEYIDGLIVSSFFENENSFAVFRYGAREFPLNALLVGGLVTGMIPVLTLDLKEGMEEMKQKARKLARMLFPISMVLMLLSPWLFPLVYNSDFASSAHIFNIYLLILCSRILLPQVVIISRQKSYFLVLSAIIETLLNVGLSLWWVGIWGLPGIALASFVAFFVNKLNMILYNWFVLNIHPNKYLPLFDWAVLSAFLIGCYIVSLQFFI